VQRSAQLGHIGLTSHTLRVEAAGGTLRLRPGPVAGTEVFVDVPWPEA
jgi:two-component system NarL family sensor kinase